MAEDVETGIPSMEKRCIPNADDITIRMLLSHRTGWIQHVFESKQFIGELLEQLKSNPDK